VYDAARDMSKGRLEAFSDGVIAILMTIMVLELRPPHGGEWHSLVAMWPVFLAYLLSFVFLGIYWNNHHHLLHAATHVNGRIMWANHALLFCLSLVPFATAWMGDEHTEPLPSAAYGAVMLASAISFTILALEIVRNEGRDSPVGKALASGGGDYKGNVSLFLYTASIPLAWLSPWVSDAIFLAVALIWIVPDTRIEAQLEKKK
jgi:uncharacterized membrane protein